jgi:hypothetical protein
MSGLFQAIFRSTRTPLAAKNPYFLLFLLLFAGVKIFFSPEEKNIFSRGEKTGIAQTLFL